MAVVLTVALCFAASVCVAAKVVLVAGGATDANSSLALTARVDAPFGVDRDANGNLLIITISGRLHAVTPDGRLTTLCGGAKGDRGDGGAAKDALMNSPHSLAVGPGGEIYIADTLNHRVRKIDSKGVITTVAGTTKGFSGDGGPAGKAQFSGVYCIAFNPDMSKLVITDLDNRRIRIMDMKSGIVTTVAGNGTRGVPKDGELAAEQPLVDPRAATMDSKGNVYLLERGDHSLRMVDAAGKIHTLIAGPKSGGVKTLAGPKHLAVDKNDDVLIADTDNHRIVRWMAKEQKLVAVAGTGKVGKAGLDGPPEQVQLNQPHGVFVDKDGTLYISDSLNNRVLKLVP